METCPPSDSGRRRDRRRRLASLTAAFIALATSLLVSSSSPSAVQANGSPTPITITTETSPHAPGMVRVAWTTPSNLPSQWPELGYYRLEWGDGTATTSVVLDAKSESSSNAVIIPNLTAATDYRISIDVVTVGAGANPYYRVGAIATATTTASTSAAPLQACASGSEACGEFVIPNEVHNTDIRVLPYRGSSSGHVTVSGTSITWSAPRDGGWPTDNDALNSNRWTRLKLLFQDASGQLAATWWDPFGDGISTYEEATDVLVPFNTGATVNIGTVTMAAGTLVTGELFKQGSSGREALVASDFVDLCVEVLKDVSSQGQQRVEFSSILCGRQNHGFGINPNKPGEWKVSLERGNYRIRFIDRPNYYGLANVLLYNVSFSAQWWREDGQRGEQLFGQPLASSVLQVTTAARENIDGVLRPAKQMRVDVIDIPFDATAAASPTLLDLEARVHVVDRYGNWTGGLMTVVTSSARPNDPTDASNPITAVTVSANVTGLVQEREYQVFLYVSNNPPRGQEGSYVAKFWVVGGANLDNASWIKPGDVVTEPWPVAPILATMHNAAGTPYGDDQACLVAFPRGANATGTPAASACTDQLGIVRLQRLPLGDYEVYAYRKSGASVVGTPLLIDDSFTVDRTLPAGPDGTAIGLADVSRLTAGAQLPNGYFAVAAVVLP